MASNHRARRAGGFPDMDAALGLLAGAEAGQAVFGKAHQAVMLRLMPMSTSSVRSASVKSRLGVASPRLGGEGDAQLGRHVGTLEMDAARLALGQVVADLLEQLVRIHIGADGHIEAGIDAHAAVGLDVALLPVAVGLGRQAVADVGQAFVVAVHLQCCDVHGFAPMVSGIPNKVTPKKFQCLAIWLLRQYRSGCGRRPPRPCTATAAGRRLPRSGS